MNILLLEDDFLYSSSIKEYLEQLGFKVEVVSDGDSACELIASTFFHLYILDAKVPNASGFEVLKYIKELDIKSPIMMMTSLSDINNIKLGYELGCDEYLKKPFELDELKFRIMQLFKIHFSNEFDVINFKDFSYNFKTKELKNKNTLIDLTQTEQKIIEHLLINQNNFCASLEITSLLDDALDESYVRVYIRRIRAKTNDDFIISKRGFGYKINV